MSSLYSPVAYGSVLFHTGKHFNCWHKWQTSLGSLAKASLSFHPGKLILDSFLCKVFVSSLCAEAWNHYLPLHTICLWPACGKRLIFKKEPIKSVSPLSSCVNVNKHLCSAWTNSTLLVLAEIFPSLITHLLCTVFIRIKKKIK